MILLYYHNLTGIIITFKWRIIIHSPSWLYKPTFPPLQDTKEQICSFKSFLKYISVSNIQLYRFGMRVSKWLHLLLSWKVKGPEKSRPVWISQHVSQPFIRFGGRDGWLSKLSVHNDWRATFLAPCFPLEGTLRLTLRQCEVHLSARF